MKVYLKFNKDDTAGYMCLMFWLEVFRDHQIVLVCDLFDDARSRPKVLQELLKKYHRRVRILNTDYSLSKDYDDLILDPRYQKAAAANFTCFKDNTDEYFWLIDADDTMFLTRDIASITAKLRLAEELIQDQKYDSLALDFYRMQNDTWSFGICLVKGSLDFSEIRSMLTQDDFGKKDTRCLDICLDKLRRKGSLSLKSFVLKDTSFLHYVYKSKNLPYALYQWSETSLGDRLYPDDFIVL